jgi:serine phosphatase RsbU (regulator of sigma subunit)
MSLELEVQIAVAKINKYATSESGDTVEVVERPRGGMSVVIADGQRSGKSAKAISNLVVRKAIGLLADGVRDGAVARATHDALHSERGGKVSAELFIVSIDLVTQTVVISRNARCPILLRQGAAYSWLAEPSEAIGIYRHTKPSISELSLAAALTVVVFTDGVAIAGSRSGAALDLQLLLQASDPSGQCNAQTQADTILAEVLRLEQNRPADDATVVVVKIFSMEQPELVRRLFMRIPI